MNWLGGARSRVQQQPGGRGGYNNYNYGGGYGRGRFGQPYQLEVTGPGRRNDGGLDLNDHNREGRRTSRLIEFVKSKVPNGNLLALQLSHQMEIDEEPNTDEHASQVTDHLGVNSDMDQRPLYKRTQLSDSDDDDVNPASISSGSSGLYSPLSSQEFNDGDAGEVLGQVAAVQIRSEFSESSDNSLFGTPNGTGTPRSPRNPLPPSTSGSVTPYNTRTYPSIPTTPGTGTNSSRPNIRSIPTTPGTETPKRPRIPSLPSSPGSVTPYNAQTYPSIPTTPGTSTNTDSRSSRPCVRALFQTPEARTPNHQSQGTPFQMTQQFSIGLTPYQQTRMIIPIPATPTTGMTVPSVTSSFVFPDTQTQTTQANE